jgi:release factor glutamine methyltransferase
VAEPATIGAALAQGRRTLEQAGCDTPRLDAELLLAEVLGVGRERLVIDREVMVDAAAAGRFAGLVARRAAREPVAYVLGRRGFRRISLMVDGRVLIPRPETELLVEVGLALPAGARVLDVGTGSGAVALALKDERPDLIVRGCDMSAGAVDVARANAAALELDVAVAQADLLEGAPAADAVLANLPYVEDGAELAPEIARWEPAGALFAGPDGLSVIRRLVAAAGRAAIALLALEIGCGQAGAVTELMRAAGYRSVEVRRDLAGLDRVVVGVR